MSRKKESLSWLLIVVVLLLVVLAAVYTLWPQIQPHTTVHLGDGVFAARVAKTDKERIAGLSGTKKLRKDQAMLFVYPSDDKWTIWMKDMNYPIDIIWLDDKKSVVHIVKNAPPESYPFETFSPKKAARYVVEVPAGTVDTKRIVVGAEARFDENKQEGVKL